MGTRISAVLARLYYPALVVLSVATMAVFSLTGYYNARIGAMATIEEGIGTCFSRLNRTYMSAALNRGERYDADRTFTATTEECFAQAVSYAQALSGAVGREIFGKVNFINNEVFWFHRALADGGNRFSGPTPPDFGTRFANIQIAVDEALELASKAEAGLSSLLFFWVCATYAAFFLLVWYSLYGYFVLRGRAPKRWRSPEPASGGEKPAVVEEDSVLLADALASCFEKLSGRVFASGTKIDIKVREGFRVAVDAKVLEEGLLCALEALVGAGVCGIVIEAKRTRRFNVVTFGASGASDGGAFVDTITKAMGTAGSVEVKRSADGGLVVALSFHRTPKRALARLEKTTKRRWLDRIRGASPGL